MTDKDKWLDYAGVESFWDRIRKSIDKKLDRVEGHDDSIRVVDRNKISVQISGAENNILQVKTRPGQKGLFVPAPPVQHKLIFGAGEEYVYDGSEDVTVPVYTGDIEEKE